MSQQLTIEELLQWDVEKCQQNFQPALQLLVSSLESELRSEVVQVLCDKFVQLLPNCELEDQLLSKLIPKIESLFDESLLSATSNSSQSCIIQSLQTCMECISYIHLCLSSLLSAQEQLMLMEIISVPPLVFHIVTGTFTLCKDSNEIYASLFSALSDQLTMLFQQACKLYKVFLELIPKLSVDSNGLPAVLSGLNQVCQIVSKVDAKLMVNSLKVIARLCCDNKQVLYNNDVICEICNSLCQDISDNMQYLQAKSEGVEKMIKVLVFKLKVLSSIIEVYPGNVQYQPVIQVMMHCHRNGLADNGSVQKLTESMITQTSFINQLTKIDTNDYSIDEERALLLVLMDITKAVSNAQDNVYEKWTEHNSSLLVIIMKVVKSASSLLIFPAEGKASGLYEVVCSNLCIFLARTPPRNFALVEKCVLESVLGSCAIMSILATDIWAFLARYSTIDVVYEQCTALCHLLHSCTPHPQMYHLAFLIHRLVKFLSPDMQAEILKHFPLSEETLLLYSLFPITPSVHSEIINRCQQSIRNTIQHNYITPASSLHMILLINCIKNNCDNLQDDCIKLLHVIPKQLPHLISSIINMLSTQNLTDSQRKQLLMLDSIDSSVCMSQLRLLQHQIHRPSTDNTSSLLSSLACSQTSPLVQLIAQQVLAEYAEQPHQENAIKHCLQSNPALHTIMIQQFNQLASGHVEDCVIDISYLKHQDHRQPSFYLPNVQWQDKNITNEKTGFINDTSLDAILDIQQAIDSLQTTRQLNTAVKMELKNMADKLNELVDTK